MKHSEAVTHTPARPPIIRELLGRELMQLRVRRGMERKTVARHLDASVPKICRLESGHVRVKESDLHRLFDIYEVADLGEQQALLEILAIAGSEHWWHEYRDVVPEWAGSYLTLESIAAHIRTYELRFIPGLLQTPAYAEAIIRPRCSPVEAARRVALRSQRQRMLFERPSPVLWAVIDEIALRQQVGPPDVMREQIEFLIKAVEWRNVTVQVLPMRQGLLTGCGNSFTIVRPRPSRLPDIVYLEHLDDAEYLADQERSDPYRLHMTTIEVVANPPDKTPDILHRILRDEPIE
jgi:hypothetical protein